MAEEMRYFSTRGGKETLSFEEAVLTGLAPNGGLSFYLHPHIPSHPFLAHFLCHLIYHQFQLLDFRHPQTTPLRKTGEKEYVLELWHGPTWAFKDVALQFLGNLFAYFLERRNVDGGKEGLTIVGATSGDTGSAAIYGVRGKPNITIFILYPDGRVSPIQLAQMASVPDPNVFCVAVQDADFDACQSIVKTLFSDHKFNSAHRLGAVNSINWARILAQIVYYFHAYLQLPAEARKDVRFVVPTGNFGDILAGWYAKKLGLPMGPLVVATNENDILERFFRTGRYEREDHLPEVEQSSETAVVDGGSDGKQGTSASGVKATHSPAMDILLSSNFERLLFYLALEQTGKREEAQEKLKGWMETLKHKGRVDIGQRARDVAKEDFWAERVSDEETLEEIAKYYEKKDFGSYVVDPHTAVGLAAQSRSMKKAPEATWVTLSTAHPAKFREAVDLALPPDLFPSFDFDTQVLPDPLRELDGMGKRIYKVKGEEGVRELIESVKRGEQPPANGHAGSI
ncbi:hypothetical protein TREMEDRAFT_39077 [Tremella mesenterica DSM 1558]|uniref:uncharacterized protein n=1 Tax=Tremella mesenterica (strain ATCC 24925 / CBS 8224 / DSM 1558 / NBRC 9311 / NRRL Y-6157 / RJB 2259-6 / UBC 559-6) TaxID=578456 RepID=UPI0003F48E38|nr:uncharacterized protein TREMEDRAFT_39077 [Tremella mesenterica DSM 1558]EIW69490.1 hypothetical protein TREMEDRAFT_39077 [Tremella mesenterica DSM 1558]